MTDYTANFAAPTREPVKRETALLLGTLVSAAVRVPLLVRRTRPMSRKRAYGTIAAPILGITLGAAVGVARDGSLERDDVADLLPSVASMAVIGVTGAAAEVALHRALAGERTHLSVPRAITYSLALSGLHVARRRAVDAARSRFNPTKRTLKRITAEQATASTVAETTATATTTAGAVL